MVSKWPLKALCSYYPQTGISLESLPNTTRCGEPIAAALAISVRLIADRPAKPSS